MSDMGESFRDMTRYKKEKRAANTQSSTRLLEANAVPFESKNGGAHLIVQGIDCTIDFWPSTGLFHIRGGRKGRGIRNLLKLCKENS